MRDAIRDNLLGIFTRYNPGLAGILRSLCRAGESNAAVECQIKAAVVRQEVPDDSLTECMALLYWEWLKEDPTRAKEAAP